VVNASALSLYPRETEPIPIAHEAGWTPGSVRTVAESLVPIGIRFPDHPVYSESTVQTIHRIPKLLQNLMCAFSIINYLHHLSTINITGFVVFQLEKPDEIKKPI
jgi:hypothetical protein